jgi:hypothetical protein
MTRKGIKAFAGDGTTFRLPTGPAPLRLKNAALCGFRVIRVFRG